MRWKAFIACAFAALLLLVPAPDTSAQMGGGVSNPASARLRLTATRSYQVVGSRPDDLGDCLTFATACKTIQGAVNKAYALDTGGNTVNIQLSVPTGPYTGAVVLNGPMTGGGTIVFTTISGGPALVTVTGANAFTLNGGATATFKNLQISTITSGAGIIANNGSTVSIGTSMIFGNVAAAMLDSRSYSNIVLSFGYTISGSATSAIHADGMGSFLLDNQVITCTGSPNFSAYFMGVGTGYVEMIGTTFSGCGTVTGIRFLVNNNGALRSDTSNINLIPGNAQGYVSKGGTFDSFNRALLPVTSGSTYAMTSDGSGGTRDAIVMFKSASGLAKTLTLLACTSSGPWQQITVKDSQGDANTSNITITAPSTTFDGAASKVINTARGVVNLQCDGVSDYNVF